MGAASGDVCWGQPVGLGQLVEQSMDIDFDEMFTQVAPTDLLLPRVRLGSTGMSAARVGRVRRSAPPPPSH